LAFQLLFEALILFQKGINPPLLFLGMPDRGCSPLFPQTDDLFLDSGYLPDERFEFLIIFGPLLHFGLEVPGDVERDRFAHLFPGDEKDRMFRPLVMTGAIVFSTLSRSGDEGSFDPGAEIWDLSEERKAFTMELGAEGFHIRIV
jgi:hypothetical protein